MKMRNTVLLLLALVAGFAQAQVTSQNDRGACGEKTLFERVTKIEKSNDWFNMYMNMHGEFDAKFNQDGRNGFSSGAFNMRQLRIEVKGNVTDWLSYRWRQRLNRGNDGDGMIDNLPNSIDFAGIGIKFNKQFSIFAGKQAAAWGGFEYDLNPIEIYQYSEIINNMSNFMTGVTLNYDMTPDQQFQFQVLDSRNSSQEGTYGKGLEESRLPLVYSLAWNANMFGNKWQTRWSASIMEEVHGKYMYYLALGNQFNFSDKCNMYVDIMSSFEQLDNKGIVSRMVLGDKYMENGHGLYNTLYNSLVAKVNYRFKPKWNVFAKGMLESAAVYDGVDGIAEGNYRTSLGYIAGVEFYPMDSNLHFYLAFIGQSNFFTEKAKLYRQSDYSTQRISLGFIYQLPMF